MSEWRPMSEHKFPWNIKDVIVLAYSKENIKEVDVHLCHVGEHGAFFPNNTTFLSLHEQGWIPFAWKADDTPLPTDASYPPMLTDYLTAVSL